MLDAQIKLFDVNIEPSGLVSKKDSERLILNSCKAILADKPYSEMDELSFADINHNDFGFGFVDIEFSFNESFKNPYMKFYASCFSLRINTLNHAIKVDTVRLKGRSKRFNVDNYTKVNQDGKMSLGIRIYFRNEEECQAVLNCNQLCIEGFIALENTKNVYGIMCRIAKTEGDWKLDEAYTYITNRKTHIFNLYH